MYAVMKKAAALAALAVALAIPGAGLAAAEKDIVDTAVGAGKFKTLLAAAEAAGLVDTLRSAGPFTVFAPTDEAFSRLPAGTVESLLKPENKSMLQSVLLYHVVAGRVDSKAVSGLKEADTVFGQSVSVKASGGSVMINGAKVVSADIDASNGIIHVVDAVLLPRNIVEVASAAGTFKTLLAAAQAAGLAETLSSGGPFTVFAPSDEAFARLPAGTVEELLKPENRDKLVAILTYHVVPGTVKAADVVKLSSAPTVNGQSVKVSVNNGKVKVDGASVLATDIPALNGVIHVIDSVIMPSEAVKGAWKESSGGSCGH